jgi:hypothetical protein
MDSSDSIFKQAVVDEEDANWWLTQLLTLAAGNPFTNSLT